MTLMHDPYIPRVTEPPILNVFPYSVTLWLCDVHRCFLLLYRVSQKKAEWWIFSTLRSVIFLTALNNVMLNKAFSAEENETNIIEIGWVILILWRFFGNTVIFKFRLIFATDECRSCRELPFICSFLLMLYLLLTRINGLPQNAIWKSFSRYNSPLIGRKNQAIFENDCVARNGH